MITDFSSVSVVIPLYNKATHVAKAIESVLNQTIRAQEIVVIDDGSTDGSADAALRIKDDRIRVISQPNRGVSAARNYGIELATSQLIAFLDADDEWHPDFLESVTELAKAYPSAGMFATAFQYRSTNGKIIDQKYGWVPSEPGLIEDYFRAACVLQPVCSSSVMVPKQVLLETGGFPEGVVMGEDLDAWMKIALRYRVAWSPKVGATISMDADSRASHAFYEGDISFAQILENWKSPNAYATEYVNKWRLLMVGSNWFAGRPDIARELLRKTRKTKLFRAEWIHWRLITFLPHHLSMGLWRLKQTLAGRSTHIHPPRSIYRTDTNK